jgi:hypothetical protein
MDAGRDRRQRGAFRARGDGPLVDPSGGRGRHHAANAADVQGPSERRAAASTFAEESNDFALALYGQLARGPGNLFFSPFSIRTVLAMAYAGARGETAAAMRRALRCTSSDDELHGAVAAALHKLNAGGRGAHELALASSLWAHAGAVPLSGYRDLIGRHYGGCLNVEDFGRPDEIAQRINRWAAEKTKKGSTTSSQRLLFDERETHDGSFYLEGGGRIDAPFMNLRGVPVSAGPRLSGLGT